MSTSFANPVVCAGVIVADHLCTPISHVPAAGELVQAEELILNIGGCASNAAVVLAKLGVGSRGEAAAAAYQLRLFDPAPVR